MAFLSKYGVARTIQIPLIKRGVVDFAVSADWTPSAGDVKISKDGGAAANVTNLPTALTMGNAALWVFSLTATEMQAARIEITVADAATKAVEDTAFAIETYGHASAQHEFDLDTASTAQTGDSFAIVNSGTHGNAALKTLIEDVPTNAEFNARTLVAASYGTAANQTTIITHLTDVKGATFDGSTDSLEALRNRGDAAWVTATGFSTHSAADVWSVGTRVLTAGTNIQLPNNGLANVTAWTVAITGNVTGNLSGSVGSVATGGIASTSFAAGAITSAACADGFITDAKITAPSEAAGIPTGVLGWIRRLFEWRKNKRTRDRSTGAVALRNTADSGNLETYTQSTSGTVDTEGASS